MLYSYARKSDANPFQNIALTFQKIGHVSHFNWPTFHHLDIIFNIKGNGKDIASILPKSKVREQYFPLAGQWRAGAEMVKMGEQHAENQSIKTLLVGGLLFKKKN